MIKYAANTSTPAPLAGRGWQGIPPAELLQLWSAHRVRREAGRCFKSVPDTDQCEIVAGTKNPTIRTGVAPTTVSECWTPAGM